jgi:hypothetical protein
MRQVTVGVDGPREPLAAPLGSVVSIAVSSRQLISDQQACDLRKRLCTFDAEVTRRSAGHELHVVMRVHTNDFTSAASVPVGRLWSELRRADLGTVSLDSVEVLSSRTYEKRASRYFERELEQPEHCSSCACRG